MSKHRQHYLDQREPKPSNDPLHLIAVGCGWIAFGYFCAKVAQWLF